ncbi:hypothetical protein PAMP_008528 [Pampus punctatissimus]
METVIKRHWFFNPLYCFLIGSLVDSSSLSSGTPSLSVTSTVGNQAILPCSWKSRLGEVALPACHIQWTTLVDTVFEQRGKQKWQTEDFEGRVDVPEEKLGSGDCSLIINDVQIRDTGRYESFMLVDGVWSRTTRVFIQSVKLSVFDHKSRQSRAPGEDLVLELYTRHSVRVVYQGSNSSEWSVLWMKGDEDSQRVKKHPVKEQLIIKELKSSDKGIYKVLDEEGLTISTVQLSVEENSTALRSEQTLENQVAADDAAISVCSALLFFSGLVANFQILHLL